MSEKRYVIVSDRDGIMVGHAMGLLFFSMNEDAGQTSVPAMTGDEAMGCLRDLGQYMDRPRMHFVFFGDRDSATIDDLKKAGLGHLLGMLLINTPSMGNA